MRRRLLCSAFLVAFFVAALPTYAATITVGSAVVDSNSPFTVLIVGSDLEDLFSFNFDLSFNPAVIDLVSVSRGSVFNELGLPCADCFSPGFSDTPGVLSFVADSLSGQVNGVDGLQTLAVLSFRSLALGGETNLAFGLVELFSPPTQGEIFPVPINEVELRNGLVTVNQPQPVPEPSTLALLGVGLAAIARRRLKKKTLA